MSAGERARKRVEQQRRLQVMLDLLRDAGANDLVATLSAEQAALLYHEVVHAVGRAAAEWRSARRSAVHPGGLGQGDESMTQSIVDNHFGKGREP